MGGKVGLVTPPACVLVSLGSKFDVASPNEIDMCLEAGINLIDTAECYGDHLSERLIGNAGRRAGRRGCR